MTFRLTALAAVLVFGAAHADETDPFAGLDRREGLVTVHAAPTGGKVLLTLPAPDGAGLIGRYIYAIRITSGVGSNPLGLDRGLGDAGRLLAFRQIGDKVVAEIENVDYRAVSDDPAERRAVAESFARSIIWSGAVVHTDADSRPTIDVSSFVTRDAFYLSTHLANRGEGNFALDANRSFPTRNALAFPDNVELEALLTFASGKPGDEIQATTPEPEALTLRMHHSLIRLPDDGYTPRAFDPRSAAIDVLWYDMAQPLTEPLAVRVARRYRLEKVNPGSAPSPVKKPIVFYVDPGAPEPIRSALVEGASWWAEAFEAAGFLDAYRVELLPQGAHPADVRYNVIQWVHRQTRGWSYGGGVADPRTGEMLKGHVILGSQRVRQDRMIFEAMVGAAENGTGSPNDPTQVALARIRQLSAHEVGHALGFYHNMAASSNDRASVMDYPAPLITLDNVGKPDLSNAYAVGIGNWDKFTVAWLYSQFDADVDEATALAALIDQAAADGLRYVADQHARSVASAHPFGSVWDNGENAIDELDRTLAVRAAALAEFNAKTLANGRELADLATAFAPLYLYHRYQVDAAAKFIGGAYFDYGVKGSNTANVVSVPFAEQRRALASLLATIGNDALAVPPRIAAQLTPPLDASEPIMGRERVASRLGPLFDKGYAAAAAARISFNALLATPRLNRLHVAASQSADSDPLPVSELLGATGDTAFAAYADAVTGNAVRDEYLSKLFEVLHDGSALPGVRAAVLTELAQRRRRLGRSNRAPNVFARRIDRELARDLEAVTPTVQAAEIPPGSPIGSASHDGCWHCDSAELLGQ
ncbi:MAG: zinc-dependent metalloprotease [Pseudomonadota bacterium]